MELGTDVKDSSTDIGEEQLKTHLARDGSKLALCGYLFKYKTNQPKSTVSCMECAKKELEFHYNAK